MYSYRFIKESLPKSKNSKSSLWVKTIIRRLSFPFTYFFINVGFSAWAASVLSIVVAVSGSVLLSINDNTMRLLGVFLVNFWLILDCVDGNIARCKNSSSEFGKFIDAISGYFISGFVYIGVGLSAYYLSDYSSDIKILFILMGSLTAVSNLLMRLMHQKYTNTLSDIAKLNYNENVQSNSSSRFNHFRTRLDKELGISGLFMPGLILSAILSNFTIITIFYFVFSMGSLGILALYYSYISYRGDKK